MAGGTDVPHSLPADEGDVAVPVCPADDGGGSNDGDISSS